MSSKIAVSIALAGALVAAAPRSAGAFSTGFAGNCASCHAGFATSAPALTAGSACVTPSSTTILTLTGKAPSGGGAGFDLAIASGGGSLAIGGPNATATQVLSADVTHSAPRAPNAAGNVTFSALFVAPASPSTVQLHAYYVASNGAGVPSTDATSQGSLTINVRNVCAPASVPATRPLGFALLAAGLLAAAVGRLTSRRRRE